MALFSPTHRTSTTLLAVSVALATLHRFRFGHLDSKAKLLYGSVAAMSILLRYILPNNSKFVTNLTQVGSRVKKGKDQVTSEYDEFDVIIVGGGTAGCVLASRLTEDSSIRVLLVEAGGSGKSVLFTRIPATFSLLFHGKHVYELHTEPQAFANDKTKYWPRGKLLGGCSSINAQMAQYGAPADFDQWAATIGDESWAWKEFKRYFTKFEKYIPDPNYPDVNKSAKGSQGPMEIGYHSSVSEASKGFITTCTKLGIPFNPDFNTSGGTRGVNRLMTYIDERRERVSAESAYLTKEVLARPNLKVVVHAQVTQVLFEQVGGETRATGVEFTNSKNGPRYRARARKEVIVSAGAIHSPQILMLSGVGPAQHLEEHKIPVVHDLPGVGSHLVDHPVVDIYLKDKLGVSINFVKPRTISEIGKLLSATMQYLFSRRGVLATNWGESAAFCRSDDPVIFPPSDYPSKLQDSTSGSDSPDLEIFTTPIAYKDHGATFFNVETFAIHSTLLRPISTGTLRLKSANPWDNPIMDPRYLESKDDVEKLVRGMKMIFKIAQTEPLASHLDQDDRNPELDHQLHLKTDDELAQIARERVETLYHPVSTCRMAPLGEGGVVDSQLRVYGIRGLRVCDASIFPEIVSGHTAGATLAVAEKLADMMKAELSNPKS